MRKQNWPDGTLGIYVITRNDPHPGYDEASGFVKPRSTRSRRAC